MKTLYSTTSLMVFMAGAFCLGAMPAFAHTTSSHRSSTATSSAANGSVESATNTSQNNSEMSYPSQPSKNAVANNDTNTVAPGANDMMVTMPAANPVVPAQIAPPAPPNDERIKQLVYNEGDVYTITTKYGYQTNIVLSPKEDIETISVGDKSVWQIIPSGNRIFIRPMEEDSITNMTVLTNKHSYQFDLKSLGPAVNEGNIYVATFIYPEEMIAAQQALAAAQAAATPPMAVGMPYIGMPPANAVIAAPPAAPATAAIQPPVVASAPVVNNAPVAYSAPLTASEPVGSVPMPATIPFGKPTPPPGQSITTNTPLPPSAPAHVSKPVGAVAKLNSEPSPPTQYIEVPSAATPVVPVVTPFGGPTPPPSPMPSRPAPVEIAAPSMAQPMSDAAVVPANANFNYTYTGADAIAPLQVFDDGKATYLKYAVLGPTLPDVYVLDSAGQVTAVPHSARNGFMVVEAVVPEMIVKDASGSVHVYNESLAPKQ